MKALISAYARTPFHFVRKAIGQPLGANGARTTGKAAALLKRTSGTCALATQCIGGGQGVATVLEGL